MGQFSLSIPTWQQSQLQALANQNDLFGVNPLIIGAIDQAESSGNPGSPNSAGYGGYFGLSPTSKYPAGTVGAGEGTNTPAEFNKEAIIAASEFASLLNTYGGDVIHAEYAYQQGGNAPYPGDAAAVKGLGPSLVSQAAGGNAAALATGGTPPPTVGVAATAGQSSIQLGGIGAALQALDKVMNPAPASTLTEVLTLGSADVITKVLGLSVRLTFSLGFIGVLYFGIKTISSSSGGSSSPGIIDSLQTQQRIGQGNRRLDLAESAQEITGIRTGQAQQRIGQTQQRIFLSQQSESRRRTVTANATQRANAASTRANTAAAREARLGAKAAEQALKTVGEAAVIE